MTSHLDPPAPAEGDDAATVLAQLRAAKEAEDEASRQVLRAAARWAAMHSADSLVGPADQWHEKALPMGGEGCPEVAEFAVVELAAALGRSRESGRRYLAQAVEGRHRLPRCWARLEAGKLPAWRLAFVAERTLSLSPRAAAYVDAHVAPFAHKLGPAQLDRIVTEAIARHDPERAEADRAAAAEGRHLDIDLAGVGISGTVRVEGELDLADALDLETAIATGAEQLRRAGSADTLDVRRSIAAGVLARGGLVLELPDLPEQSGAPRRRGRRVVLHVHLSQEALLGAGGLARVEGTAGPVTAEQVRLWCAGPETRVTVTPVLDLAEHLHVDAYEIPDRLKAQVALRDLTCTFPYCARPAVRCDTDHRIPYDDGGPTCTDNLALLCRGHHRAKTTGGWSYLALRPGTYLWRSPLSYRYLRDHTGTVDVSVDVSVDLSDDRTDSADSAAEREP